MVSSTLAALSLYVFVTATFMGNLTMNSESYLPHIRFIILTFICV